MSVTSIVDPVDPAGGGVLNALLRAVDRYGLGNVLTLVLLIFMLLVVYREISANTEMLQKHVAATTYSNYLLYQVCVGVTVQAGLPESSCNFPEGLK